MEEDSRKVTDPLKPIHKRVSHPLINIFNIFPFKFIIIHV